MRAIHCTQMAMVSNWPQWSVLLNDTKYVIRYHRNIWVNCVWTRVTINILLRFRQVITSIGYDVIFQTAFRPFPVLFFSWNFAVIFRVSIRSAPQSRIFESRQGGQLRRHFILCVIVLVWAAVCATSHHMFIMHQIPLGLQAVLASPFQVPSSIPIPFKLRRQSLAFIQGHWIPRPPKSLMRDRPGIISSVTCRFGGLLSPYLSQLSQKYRLLTYCSE